MGSPSFWSAPLYQWATIIDQRVFIQRFTRHEPSCWQSTSDHEGKLIRGVFCYMTSVIDPCQKVMDIVRTTVRWWPVDAPCLVVF